MGAFAYAWTRTLASVREPAVWRVVLLSVALNTVVWAVILGSLWFLLQESAFTRIGWIEHILDYLGEGLAVMLTFILFPLTFPVASSLFLDSLAASLEQKHYAGRLHPRKGRVRELCWSEIRFLVFSMFLNLILLPFYLLPGLNIVVYCLINGYLLGREFFSMVATRYSSVKEVDKLRKKNRLKLVLAGAMMMGVSLIPIINLLIPVLMVVFMVHFYQKLQ